MTVRAAGELLVRGWRWWIGELADLWPFGRQRADRRRSDILLLEIDSSRVSACRWIDGRSQELASVPRDVAVASVTDSPDGKGAFSGLAGLVDPAITPVVVRVAPQEVLTRTVSLPAAAAENLREVLAFEMHRRTPFAADEVYFDFRPLPERADDPHVHVELSLVRRKLVDAALALLPPWNLRVAGMADVPGLEGEGLLLNLAPPSRGPSTSRGLARVLWVANAALLAAVVVIPFVHQDRRIEELSGQVAVAKAEAEGVAALRQQAETLRADRRFLIDAKRDRPALVTLIAELTAALPDGTWVQRLEIKSGRVRLRGTSTTASSLIPIIEDSPRFHNAAFNAPVTRNPTTGKEQFQLIFDITSPTDAHEDGNGQNLQKSAGAIAATGGLHRLR
jgi:general secretion pathway protein L